MRVVLRKLGGTVNQRVRATKNGHFNVSVGTQKSPYDSSESSHWVCRFFRVGKKILSQNGLERHVRRIHCALAVWVGNEVSGARYERDGNRWSHDAGR